MYTYIIMSISKKGNINVTFSKGEVKIMTEARKIGLYNHKGGVGKTTSVINIAYFLQKAGKKILVADCDSQRNCFSFFTDEPDYEIIQNTRYENIRIARYNRYTAGLTKSENFDFVIFDMPPAMTDEVKEIIRQCDSVFVPTILGEFEVAGLADVTSEIQKQNSRLGGVFATMFNAKNDAGVLDEFGKLLKNRLMATIIPYSPTVRESQKSGLSLEEYFDSRKTPNVKSSRKIVHAYEALTNEILERSGV